MQQKTPTDHHRKPIWLTAGSHKAEEAEGQSQAEEEEKGQAKTKES
jgi:hypothetical protein